MEPNNETPASTVAEHYQQVDLIDSIRAGLDALAKTPDTVTLADLAPVEEFHVGGRAATQELCQQLAITGADRVLDLGCGIGGLTRFIASTFGAAVTGVDLTPQYIDAAVELTRWLGLDGLIDYEVASATDLPFDNESFDVATMLHVGMNIVDKDALFSEAHRVLAPGATMGIYDNMWAGTSRELAYPVPWASSSDTSFVQSSDEYTDAATSAGFTVVQVRDRRNAALDFFASLRSRSSRAKTSGGSGPPPLGLHLLMGPDAGDKTRNLAAAITANVVAPTEIILRKP